MARVFDGFTSSASWLEDFLVSQSTDELKKETLATWEDDVIKAVKARRYNGVDEALADLRSRTGLTERAMSNLKNGIVKKVAADQEWHDLHGTITPELRQLAQTKKDLIAIANDLDVAGRTDVSDEIDAVIKLLP